MDRRRGLVVALKLFVIGVAAVGCVVLLRYMRTSDTRLLATPVSPVGSQPPISGAAPAPGESAGSSVNAPADDWMQAYRGMTLEQAFETVARQIRFEPYAGIQRGARGTGGQAVTRHRAGVRDKLAGATREEIAAERTLKGG